MQHKPTIPRVCPTCNASFLARESKVLAGLGVFCSVPCRRFPGRKRATFDNVALFWKKVAKSDGCWEWGGFRMPNGYGQIAVRGERVLTHRYSFELERGPIPSGMAICHRCDNPPCVRPDHLFVGTQQDNIRDMIRKGRHVHPVRSKSS